VILTKPQSSAHWYHADGTPQHTVIGANGKERPTTLRDARKLNLFPSVTTIIGIISKPGLESWKVEQGILAALTLPREIGETDDAFAERVSADMKAQVVKAGDFGTRLHAAIEAANLYEFPENTDTELDPWLAHYGAWKDANIIKVIRAEDRLVHTQLGYAGTFDLLADHQAHGVCLIDFKTQNVKDKPKFYDQWAWQLAAYRAALGMNCHCLSVVIDSNAPSAPVEKLWTEEELIDGLEIFHHATRIWQVMNGYVPRSE
jgi:hypothetical protein